MTFIDLESGDMFGVRGPDCIDLVDIAKNASPSKIVEGVWRVVTYGENIYVLYDHNTVFEEDYEEKPVNATIRVFNWNGEFIADLIPDALITKFCIDEQTGKLIAIDNNENFYIADIAL